MPPVELVKAAVVGIEEAVASGALSKIGSQAMDLLRGHVKAPVATVAETNENWVSSTINRLPSAYNLKEEGNAVWSMPNPPRTLDRNIKMEHAASGDGDISIASYKRWVGDNVSVSLRQDASDGGHYVHTTGRMPRSWRLSIEDQAASPSTGLKSRTDVTQYMQSSSTLRGRIAELLSPAENRIAVLPGQTLRLDVAKWNGESGRVRTLDVVPIADTQARQNALAMLDDQLKQTGFRGPAIPQTDRANVIDLAHVSKFSNLAQGRVDKLFDLPPGSAKPADMIASVIQPGTRAPNLTVFDTIASTIEPGTRAPNLTVFDTIASTIEPGTRVPTAQLFDMLGKTARTGAYTYLEPKVNDGFAGPLASHKQNEIAGVDTRDVFRPHTGEGLLLGLSRFAPSFSSRVALAAVDYAGYRLYDYLSAKKVNHPGADAD